MAAGVAIAVGDLSKRFGRGRRAVQALKGVSLSVAPGEIYGLLGRNGAGKTTLVKILLDIARPTLGWARLLDRPSGSPAARRGVGYLPEDHRLPEYRTGERALRFYAALSGHAASRMEERIRELLEQLGLVDAAPRKIRTYSKGMKQRLALAQALVHDPEVLLLDEPTDGVDPVGRAQIRDILVRLKGEGKTIFLNSHLLSEVERVCDRVGILEKGRLVCEGTIDALTSADRTISVHTEPRPGEEVLEGLRRLAVSVVPTPEGIEVKVASERDIDSLIDLLRSHGIRIRELSAKKLTLEEVFLDLVEGGERGGLA